jgi:hypothetical protein
MKNFTNSKCSFWHFIEQKVNFSRCGKTFSKPVFAARKIRRRRRLTGEKTLGVKSQIEEMVFGFMDEQDLDELILDMHLVRTVFVNVLKATGTNVLVLQVLGGITRMAILRTARTACCSTQLFWSIQSFVRQCLPEHNS